MNLSVIIPVYRVETYIARCARSLLEQTMQEGVEFIFVDDASPDGSMAVLERVIGEYPERQQQVHILHHETNRGLPTARNTGLAAATGEYVFHCDSDDFMEPDALQQLWDAARRNDADAVYSDFYLTTPKGNRYMRCPAYTTAAEALQGLLHGTMKYNVWNKLVRRSLYSNLTKASHTLGSLEGAFPNGHAMGEDMTMLLLFAKAQRVAYLPIATYHYVRQNEHAFTAARSEASYDDLRYNAERVIRHLAGNVAEEDLACFKLNVKFPFLISSRREDYERWCNWFPEADAYIPLHQVSLRSRLLERSAAHGFHLPLLLHYLLLRLFQNLI